MIAPNLEGSGDHEHTRPREPEPEPIERACRAELAALQPGRRKRSLNHAQNNLPMYRGKFEAAGVCAKDIQGSTGNYGERAWLMILACLSTAANDL